MSNTIMLHHITKVTIVPNMKAIIEDSGRIFYSTNVTILDEKGGKLEISLFSDGIIPVDWEEDKWGEG
jgi:hypothetical protein